MSKHTPGPWNWENDRTILVAENGERIASDADAQYDLLDGPNADANANLIAAAPDLLAACKAALDRHNYQGDGRPWPQLFDKIRDAIAKAEGNFA